MSIGSQNLIRSTLPAFAICFLLFCGCSGSADSKTEASKQTPPDQQEAKTLSENQRSDSQSDPVNTEEMLGKLEIKAAPKWGFAEMLDDNGKKIPPLLILGIKLTGEPAKEATHFGHVTMNGSVAGGRELDREMAFLESEDISRAYEKVDRNGIVVSHPANGVFVPVEFKNPGAGVKQVSYSGHLKLKTGGRTIVVKVSNLATTDGTPFENEHLEELGITCKASALSKNSVRLDLYGNLDVIQSVVVTNKEGVEHEKYAGGGSFGGSSEYSYDLDFQDTVPDDAEIRLTLRVDTIELEVPFDFHDVRISAAQN